MKLSDAFNPVNHIVQNNEIYEHYQLDIDHALMDTPTPDVARERITREAFTYQLDEADLHFYRALYVPFGTYATQEGDARLVALLGAGFSERLRIGENEKDLLDFLSASKRLLLLVSDIGRGKTTLLRYVYLYLLTQCQALASSVIPLYVAAENELNDLAHFGTPPDIVDTLMSRAFRPRLRKAVEPFTSVQDEQFWAYAKNLPQFARLAADENAWAESVPADERRALILEARRRAKHHPDFPLCAAKYVTAHKNRTILLILDNVDPLSLQAHRAIIEEMPRLVQDYGLRVVIAARTFTLDRLAEEAQGAIATIPSIIVDLIPCSVPTFLTRRLHMVVQRARTRPFTHVTVGGAEISQAAAQSVLSAMCDLLLRGEEVATVLSNVAFLNFRKLAVLLKTYFRSGYIRDSELALEILKLRTAHWSEYQPQLWVLLTSIITDNHDTYFSRVVDHRLYDCIINLYCNGSHNVNDKVIRVHVLQFLGAEPSREQWGFREVADAYLPLLGGDREAAREALCHAVRRLLDCNLVESPERYKVAQDQDVSDLRVLRRSTKGEYYLKTFRNYFEYTSLMKDDAELGSNPAGIADCIRAPRRDQRYAETAKFLALVCEDEVAFVAGLGGAERRECAGRFLGSRGERFAAWLPCKAMVEYGQVRGVGSDQVGAYAGLLKRMAEARKNLLGETD